MKLPGFQNDEAGDCYVAGELIHNKKLPYGLTKPQGAIPGYLLAPFLLFINDTVVATRLGNIFYAALALVFLFYFVKAFFPFKELAYYYILFTAFHPSFILTARIGSETRTILIFFEALFLFFIYRWYKTGSVLHLAFAFLAMGMGCASHICFAWFIAVMAISFFLFRPDKDILAGESTYVRFIKFYLPSFFAFVIGASSYIYYFIKENLLRDWILKCFPVSELGVNNTNYLMNLKEALKYFFEVIKGSFMFMNLGIGLEDYYLRTVKFIPFLQVFMIFIFWIIFSLALRLDSQNGFSKKKKLFLLLIIPLVMLQTPFTVTHVPTYHLLMLVPFITLIMIYGLADFTKTLRLNIILPFLVFLMVLQNLAFVNSYYKAIVETGGKRNFTDAIYALRDWLLLNPELKLVCVDNRFDFSLLALTKGKINGEEREAEFKKFLNKEYNNDADKQVVVSSLMRLFLDPSKIYITFRNNSLRFIETLKEYGFNAVFIKDFKRRDGVSEILAYKIVALGKH
ncbi:MAG: hypothetical protein PHY56_07280 [Candidatus Omnitrophica bacterium]|nr:hypothetical protein [Candidatus Omnitrophota bacterium]